MNNQNFKYTCDKSIRVALMADLVSAYKMAPQARIIEELGITHGTARVDIAVVNGSIHGYELKSDIDTLYRLPEQIRIYNSVLDRVTLVVGKNHLHEAIKIIPEWWGMIIAKVVGDSNEITFCEIRDADDNTERDSVAIASLLWRKEALNLLEEMNEANGVRSKPRIFLYERLASVLDQESLRAKVREQLCARVGWRSDLQYTSGGD